MANEADAGQVWRERQTGVRINWDDTSQILAQVTQMWSNYSNDINITHERRLFVNKTGNDHTTQNQERMQCKQCEDFLEGIHHKKSGCGRFPQFE